MKTHNRQSVRLKEYDYTQEGAYSVTICTKSRKCLFGDIIDEKMVLNEYGKIVDKCCEKIPEHFPHVELDEYIIMPNHIHGIINICGGTTPCRGTACRAPTYEWFGKPVRGSLSTIIRSFKSAVTRQINMIHNTPAKQLWQRNYYDHVIRDAIELYKIREYIVYNPAKWEEDEYYSV